MLFGNSSGEKYDIFSTIPKTGTFILSCWNIATPFLAKAGIVKAKNYGDLKIKALKIEATEK